LVTVHFKDVGQGDSILLEWSREGENIIGIIDCNLIGSYNPTLEYLKTKPTARIEFIILTHFHSDHFSGMADIFEYCIEKDIRVNSFYHSIGQFVSEIYNRIFTSKKLEVQVERFFKVYNLFDDFVEDKIQVSAHLAKLHLENNVFLSFLAPVGKIYDEMAKQLSRKVNKIATTPVDVNKLSTIILIENDNQSIILTSDAVKKSFKKIRNRISSQVILSQAPHHGSVKSLDDIFWLGLDKTEKCPVVFSVGNEPKDKLPNLETVAFFDNNDFDVYSTNFVFGVSDYFGLGTSIAGVSPRTKILNSFSKLRKSRSDNIRNDKFNGDKMFRFW